MTAPELASLSFRGEWRRYQQLALAAFDLDRAAGKRRTHIVAPPGSGKTLLGVEIVRRLGSRALVLVPNSAIQAQWPEAAARFTDDPAIVAPDASAPVACLTYQALAQLDDPGAALAGLAERRWAAERAAATGESAEQIAAAASSWTGAAAVRRRRDLARITASIKREIARGEHGGVTLAELLSPAARRRVDELRAGGVATVVLDECHHLASLWGYVVRTLLAELADVYVVGLTATPPDALTTEEQELYAELLGPVDFTVPTPAVVRDGYLAPYQELAWLTPPLDSEQAWLREHDVRFQELITRLHDDEEGPLSFPGWVLTRLRERTREEGDSEVSWAGFQRANPLLARAGVRFLASAGLALAPGVPRGEGYREQPDLDDWVALLQDYALRCLRADPSAAASARYDAIAAALRDLGFQLTRRGIRRGASEVDRLLTGSAAKALALVEVVAAEAEARGDALRALVLVDAEAERLTSDELVGVLDAAAGTAPAVLRALADDARTAVLRPLVVSGRGLRCRASDAEALAAALGIEGVRAEPSDDLAQLVGSGAAWQPRTWVVAATAAFEHGATRLLVGTRALLGEGWDAPCVNVLVDLTAATTGVSVQQMRGRSLRLDPADPEKIASNWDVVCVAADLARGSADYERFVRKHLHLFAPTEDGEIEAGPSHVHPALGPFAPPPVAEFPTLNRQQAGRAADHADARRRWRIGEPYAGDVLKTLVVRPRTQVSGREPPPESPPSYPVDRRLPLAVGASAALASGAAAVAAHAPELLVGLAAFPAAVGWAAVRLRTVRSRLPATLPLELVARAVADAYAALGELRAQAARSLAIEPRASGYLRCFLRDATPGESARFVSALDQALAVADAPRYLVTRLVDDPHLSTLSLLFRRRPFVRRLSPVPDDLGRTRARADAFAAAWRRWLGPSELVFAQRTDAAREALAEAAAAPEQWEAQRRDVWV